MPGVHRCLNRSNRLCLFFDEKFRIGNLKSLYCNHGIKGDKKLSANMFVTCNLVLMQLKEAFGGSYYYFGIIISANSEHNRPR